MCRFVKNIPPETKKNYVFERRRNLIFLNLFETFF